MTFKIINNEQGHMSLKGYRIVSDAKTFWDKEVYETLVNNLGANYVDALFDDLYDGVLIQSARATTVSSIPFFLDIWTANGFRSFGRRLYHADSLKTMG